MANQLILRGTFSLRIFIEKFFTNKTDRRLFALQKKSIAERPGVGEIQRKRFLWLTNYGTANLARP